MIIKILITTILATTVIGLTALAYHFSMVLGDLNMAGWIGILGKAWAVFVAQVLEWTWTGS